MLVKLGMMQNKLIIGLTGGSGCGKSIVAKAAVDLGFKHIDADILGHKVILKPNEAYYKLINEFGEEILDENRVIDRKKLGKIVFADSEKLKMLNKIVHPAIINMTKNLLADFTIIDGAVIHLTPEIVEMCDVIIAVTNSDERRIEFICNRDGISMENAKKRIASQPDNDFYSDFADVVIHSDCDIDELYEKSKNVIRRCICEKNI